MNNTTENNKLIAEFMGFTEQTNPKERWFGQWFTNENIRTDLLHFDSDWNWLMTVVEKMENSGVKITIGRMYCEIKYSDLFDKNKTFEITIASGVKINGVNGAVVEFIQWYNKNK